MVIALLSCEPPLDHTSRDDTPGGSVDAEIDLSPGSGTGTTGVTTVTPPDVYLTPLPPSRCDPADPLCVDLAATSPLWWTESGWEVRDVQMGDVDGDADLDAVVDLRQGDGLEGTTYRASVILAPFTAVKVLPRDEDISILAPMNTVADVSGDGVADLVTEWESGEDLFDPELAVIVGPLTLGQPDVATTAVYLEDEYSGVLRGGQRGVWDEVWFLRDTASLAVVELWNGTWDTWGTVDPSMTVTLTCYEQIRYGLLGDLDADGAAELSVYGTVPGPYYPGTDCIKWVVPGSATGAVDLPGFADAVYTGITQPVWLGDVNADGSGDFLIDEDRATIGADYLAGPLSMDPATYPGGTPLFASPTPYTLEPIFVDLNGDGQLDFRFESAEVEGNDHAGVGIPPPASVYSYVTSSDGVYTGYAVGHVIADSQIETMHVAGSPPLVIGHWRSGADAIAVIPVPGL